MAFWLATGGTDELCGVFDSSFDHEIRYALQYIDGGVGVGEGSCPHLDGAGTGHDELDGVAGGGNAATTDDWHVHCSCYFVDHGQRHRLDGRPG